MSRFLHICIRSVLWSVWIAENEVSDWTRGENYRFNFVRVLETSLLPVLSDPPVSVFFLLLFPCSYCSAPSLIQLWLHIHTNVFCCFMTTRGCAVIVWAILILHLQYIMYTVCAIHAAGKQFKAKIKFFLKLRCRHKTFFFIKYWSLHWLMSENLNLNSIVRYLNWTTLKCACIIFIIISNINISVKCRLIAIWLLWPGKRSNLEICIQNIWERTIKKKLKGVKVAVKIKIVNKK